MRREPLELRRPEDSADIIAEFNRIADSFSDFGKGVVDPLAWNRALFDLGFYGIGIGRKTVAEAEEFAYDVYMAYIDANGEPRRDTLMKIIEQYAGPRYRRHDPWARSSRRL
jgi:hypothetical protein